MSEPLIGKEAEAEAAARHAREATSDRDVLAAEARGQLEPWSARRHAEMAEWAARRAHQLLDAEVARGETHRVNTQATRLYEDASAHASVALALAATDPRHPQPIFMDGPVHIRRPEGQ